MIESVQYSERREHYCHVPEGCDFYSPDQSEQHYSGNDYCKRAGKIKNCKKINQVDETSFAKGLVENWI